jgi:hypothetical protein
MEITKMNRRRVLMLLAAAAALRGQSMPQVQINPQQPLQTPKPKLYIPSQPVTDILELERGGVKVTTIFSSSINMGARDVIRDHVISKVQKPEDWIFLVEGGPLYSALRKNQVNVNATCYSDAVTFAEQHKDSGLKLVDPVFKITSNRIVLDFYLATMAPKKKVSAEDVNMTVIFLFMAGLAIQTVTQKSGIPMPKPTLDQKKMAKLLGTDEKGAMQNIFAFASEMLKDKDGLTKKAISIANDLNQTCRIMAVQTFDYFLRVENKATNAFLYLDPNLRNIFSTTEAEIGEQKLSDADIAKALEKRDQAEQEEINLILKALEKTTH